MLRVMCLRTDKATFVLILVLTCLRPYLSLDQTSANLYNISVKNGTFEEGSFDVEMTLKIKPPPKTVLIVSWYRSVQPSLKPGFYTIDNTKHSVEHNGDLAKRTMHIETKDEHDYSLSLVIRNPTEKDQGEYVSKIGVTDQSDPLVAHLRLTKLEPLRDVSGENKTFQVGSSEVTLSMQIGPQHAKIYWIKCFHRAWPDPSAHFYTQDRNLDTVIAVGNLGKRLSHTEDIVNGNLRFSLVIRLPNSSDAGAYCCQIDAAGLEVPKLVILWLDVSTSSTNKGREHLLDHTTTVSQEPLIAEQGNFGLYILLIVLSTFFLVMATGRIIFLQRRKDKYKHDYRRLSAVEEKEANHEETGETINLGNKSGPC